MDRMINRRTMYAHAAGVRHCLQDDIGQSSTALSQPCTKSQQAAYQVKNRNWLEFPLEARGQGINQVAY